MPDQTLYYLAGNSNRISDGSGLLDRVDGLGGLLELRAHTYHHHQIKWVTAYAHIETMRLIS